MLFPRQIAPALATETLRHGPFDLATQTPERFTLICFYRGLHCPICATYLKELERLLPEFAKRGVEVIAVSSDDAARGAAMAEKIKAGGLRIGHGLSLDSARAWGLYISQSRGTTSIGIEEPEHFSEPGLFLVRPDGTLYYGSTQTMPFARPNFADLLGALDFTIPIGYPARGEYTGPV